MALRELLVDVSYRGLEVARGSRLSDLGPKTAYLELSAPLPVGAELALSTQDGPRVIVRVARVQEQVAGAEQPPGVWVRTSDLDAVAGAWWRERVTRQEDVQIPEPVGGSKNGQSAAAVNGAAVAAVASASASAASEPPAEPEARAAAAEEPPAPVPNSSNGKRGQGGGAPEKASGGRRRRR